MSFSKNMWKYSVKNTLMLACISVISGCTTVNKNLSPDSVTFERKNLYPEGISFNTKTQEFLLSSLRLGEIGAVNMAGQYRTLIQDPDLLSVIGIKYEEKNDRILACNSHLGVTEVPTDKAPNTVAQLYSFNAKTGKRQAVYDLAALRPGSAHFCNDIAFDNYGNLYATDSFSPIIYHISAGGVASIFSEAPQLAVKEPGKDFGFNGILNHPDNYLLINHQALGKLYKLNISSREIKEVKMDQDIPSADGMVFVNSKAIDVVKNGLSGQAKETVRLTSEDGWNSAKQVGATKAGDILPTTAVRAGTSTYVIDSRATELFDGKGARSNTFTINKARLNN